MRLACFGWVGGNSGSVAAGNLVLLQTLLDRGHEIHLFGEDGFVDPQELVGRPRYQHHVLPLRTVTRLARKGTFSAVLLRVLGQCSFPIFARSLRRRISAAHSRHRYDALVFLGTEAFCRVSGLPVIAWIQGAGQEEARAFRRRRKMVIAAAGWPRYVLYSTYYRVDHLANSMTTVTADLTICTSRWTRDALMSYKNHDGAVAILPYPMDFEQFTLAARPSHPGLRILHLGRCDPRKRIDLLVSAFRLVREQFPNAELVAVGRPGVVPRIVDLFGDADLGGRVSYITGVPRNQVPDLLHSADVLVQTSESENFGSSVVEAMACGIPVVVGPTNGTADYIDPESELFTAYTPDAVAKAISVVLERSRQEEAAARAKRRGHAMKLLGPETVARHFEALVEEVRR